MPKPQQDIYGDNRWMSTHEMFVAELKDKEPDVLFLGDSHIAWLEQSDVFKELLAPLHCLCFGGVADTTDNVLWRIDNGELESIKPKAIVVLAGGWNAGQTADEVSAGVARVAEAIRQKQPRSHVIVLKLLPSGRHPNARRELVSKVNERLEQTLRDVDNTQLLDIDPGFVGADGSIDHHDMFDYVHLSQEGYRKSFETVYNALQVILNPEL